MKEVNDFENILADYFGSKYAVATDCCTHAIELCLRLKNHNDVSCPKNTYLSIPMTFMKLGLRWNFVDHQWANYYQIGNTNIIDAATYWKDNGYVPGTMMCLSFQFSKHLSLGRGGMILIDDRSDYDKLKKMSYDGRTPNILWKEQDIEMLGYHYYMTPETAINGIDKFFKVKNVPARTWTSDEYPDLSKMKVFNVK